MMDTSGQMLDSTICRSKSQSTYIYGVQGSVWRLPNYWPSTVHPLSTQRERPPPALKAWYTLTGRRGGGGSIFRKTSDIVLASYSIIPLLSKYTLPIFIHLLRTKPPSFPFCVLLLNETRQFLCTIAPSATKPSPSPTPLSTIILLTSPHLPTSSYPSAS
jgi:hypothetical protein